MILLRVPYPRGFSAKGLRPPPRRSPRGVVWKGLDEPTAAFFVGLTALSTVVVRPLTGWLGDRQSKQRIGAIGVLLGGLALVVLAHSDGAL